MATSDSVAYRAYGESFYVNLRSLWEFFTCCLHGGLHRAG